MKNILKPNRSGGRPRGEYINKAIIRRIQGMKPAEINLVMDVFAAQAMSDLLSGKLVRMHGLGKIVPMPARRYFDQSTQTVVEPRAKYRFKFVPGYRLELMRVPSPSHLKLLDRYNKPEPTPEPKPAITIDAGTVTDAAKAKASGE